MYVLIQRKERIPVVGRFAHTVKDHLILCVNMFRWGYT